jgi:hypothetical protein
MDGSGVERSDEAGVAGSAAEGQDCAGSLRTVPDAGEGNISATVVSRKHEKKSG